MSRRQCRVSQAYESEKGGLSLEDYNFDMIFTVVSCRYIRSSSRARVAVQFISPNYPQGELGLKHLILRV